MKIDHKSRGNLELWHSKFLLIPIAKLFYIASIDFSQLLKHFVNTDFKTKDVSRICPSDGGLDYMVISMQFSGYVLYLSF